jgi:hypothetical protein
MTATQTKPRQSRKSGDPKGDQAEADRRIAAENAKLTPKPELCPHDLDPATCAECNGTAAAEREAEAKPEQPKAEDEREDEDGEDGEDEPEPSLPTAQLNIGRYPYWMHRPSVTAPDGTKHTCPHRDGHTKVKDAMTCARSIASEHGVTIPAADPSWTDGGPGEPVS